MGLCRCILNKRVQNNLHAFHAFLHQLTQVLVLAQLGDALPLSKAPHIHNQGL